VQIGRYEVIRELGRGAQSVVYLARDPQLDRPIAIKTMHFATGQKSANAALLGESRIVGRLRHPNIVPIFDAGEADGDPYLVFEYVPGKTLAQVLREGGVLPALKSAQLMLQVLDGVGHAHAQGIVHRDLKPSNILLDESGAARVMDFGVAARIAAPRAGEGEYIGTPSYMAPEYIDSRTFDFRTDVFAAGLVLYEMLTGQRAVAGNDIYQVMHRLANEDIVLPPEARNEIDDRLVDLLYKALARDPELRFADAGEFREALAGFLGAGGEEPGESSPQSTLDFLLRRMRHNSDFPALSESVSAINRIAHSEKDSIAKLSNAILRDVALTNKILRLVNSAFYRQAGAGRISTVSRAVLVLGFDAVRNLAITVLLFEHLQKSPARTQLMEEFVKANFAALLGRDLARKTGGHEGEQVFICALFHSLGRMLSQYYFPDEAEAVRRLMQQKELTEAAASAQVLGIAYDELGIGVAQSWGFPPLIVDSMRRLPDGTLRKPRGADETLHHVAGYANALCAVVAGTPIEARGKALKRLSVRFADSVPVADKEVEALLEKGLEEVGQFASVVHLDLKKMAIGRQIRAWAGHPAGVPEREEGAEGLASLPGTLLDGAPPLAGQTGGVEAGEAGGQVAADAQSVLAAGIQDISNTLVEGFKLNDVLRIVMETMYRALAFRRVIFCIRDPRINAMAGRFGFGPDGNEMARHMHFSLQGEPDVFLAAVTRGVDILISNTADEHIRARIPGWYRKAFTAQTFVLLPLTIKGKPVALIYADREHAGEIVIPERELSLLRTLRNQALLAIKQAG
jgi:serine/threonine protein kinase